MSGWRWHLQLVIVLSTARGFQAQFTCTHQRTPFLSVLYAKPDIIKKTPFQPRALPALRIGIKTTRAVLPADFALMTLRLAPAPHRCTHANVMQGILSQTPPTLAGHVWPATWASSGTQMRYLNLELVSFVHPALSRMHWRRRHVTRVLSVRIKNMLVRQPANTALPMRSLMKKEPLIVQNASACKGLPVTRCSPGAQTAVIVKRAHLARAASKRASRH